MSYSNLHNRSINAIRFLAADAIRTAKSGHPGLPLGAAAMAYSLWTRHLRFNPKNPTWADRDRFVLSAGHGCMLLYALLHLTGYDLPKEELMKFRQWGSRTPGHPEYGHTPGVEVTTGPLGQGIGNAVGMAIAETHLAAVFNRPGHNIIDHKTYAIATDGDLMEGVAQEAASLAGHLKLGDLVVLYDDNRVTIDGSIDLTFTEDRALRFKAYGWHVQNVADGNDVDAVDAAIQLAKKDPRPSMIICRTTIGYGLPSVQDTAEAHGKPPSESDLEAAKTNAGWPLEPPFYVPEDVLEHYREIGNRGKRLESQWHEDMEKYQEEFPDLAAELKRRLAGELPEDWENALPEFEPDSKGAATRATSGEIVNALAPHMPELMGGSSDLTPSNKTWIQGSRGFQADTAEGRNVHFGVREHVMGAAINGMAVHGGVIPYGGTFLVFSDYMRPAIRLSALSSYPSIWVFTHDSIGLGEDGPTHQPIEHLASLRAIPNLVVIRPNDANEVVEAWKVAIKRRDAPTLISLTRQKVPILDRTVYNSAKGLAKGAYVLKDLGTKDPEIILMASGSEVDLIAKAGQQLAKDGFGVRLVSFPSWELFSSQDSKYCDSVLPPSITKRLAIEAAASLGWKQWIGPEGISISIDRFGASAPYSKLFKEYGFTIDNVLNKARFLLQNS
jgi:transketolase